MFAICTKLLENPNLLALFFCEKEPDADASSTGTPRKGSLCLFCRLAAGARMHARTTRAHTWAKRARGCREDHGVDAPAAARPSAVVSDDPVTEHEFPVFVYLLHFINDTGHVGDYARAALLHCLEVRIAAVFLRHFSRRPTPLPAHEAAWRAQVRYVGSDTACTHTHQASRHDVAWIRSRRPRSTGSLLARPAFARR